ncbi:DEAD/DEAH box helicase [Micromonospora sp. CPCC 205711]|uniref:DEAD/DEAH box helicase n=1 Tax=Micromonospora sp. CPCC 205547 TaxID=3122400 RepID=UPI002FEEA462
MTAEVPTIAETIIKIQEALRDYIEATYHVGHPTLIDQRRALLEQEGVLFRAPFIESTPRYKTDRRFIDLDLDPEVQTLFASLTSRHGDTSPLLYDPPYTHQAQALEWTARDGRSLAVTTGTGSGKTESFLLPMLAKLAAEAAHRPDSFEAPAVRALVLYPMNALVNDQLGRLRLLLGDPRVATQFTAWAGRPARFARYTSRTLYPGVRKVEKDQERLRAIEKFYILLLDQAADPTSPSHADAVALIDMLQTRGKWPAKPDLKAWYGASGTRWKDKKGEFVRAVMRPEDPELLTRHEVLSAPPDVLITNYSMLEYMLMRPLERPVFDATRAWLANNPIEKFLLIIDEAHLYRGAAGAEVALLLRRLRARLGISADRLQVICTSASFASPEYAREFAAQLTGKSENDFRTVAGQLALRDQAATGTAEDAAILAAVPMADYYKASSDEARTEAVRDLLDHRGVTAEEGAAVGSVLHDALSTWEPMSLLVNETMQQAQPVDELGSIIFPSVDKELADRAVSALVALGSAARRSANDAGLLPCRVHAFFRGLPGLWACIDPDCSEVDRKAHPVSGPVGALYAQPQATCGCGARVFELYTCRHCGSAYARTYTDDLIEPSFLWHEQGGQFQAASGAISELQPLDLLLEAPVEHNVEPADIDLVTGRLNPDELGERNRAVFLPTPRAGEAIIGDEDEDEDEAGASGQFTPCGVCGQRAGFGRSSVQDHQTKGDQPFQALVTRQLEVQPAGAQEYSDFAPLRGRKVLAFSDSRQVAARLAPNLQTYSMRDAIRPLVLRGWQELSTQPMLASVLSLEQMYLAAMVGARLLSVRLRPELRPAESLEPLKEVAKSLENGALEGNLAELMQLSMTTYVPPQALLRAMYATLTDRYYGFSSLGLASIRERASLGKTLLAKLPDIGGVATTEETKQAVVRLWLAQWMTSTRGVWFPSMTDGEWWKTKGGVKPHGGKFKQIQSWLGTAPARKQFVENWLPTLVETFCEGVGGNFKLLASRVALELGGLWGYCERCRFTQRPFPGTTRCISCGHDRVRTLDPDEDPVFQARKGYYRASAARALADPPVSPMSIIAAEHTAQLNAAQSDEVFSKAEEHELLFQDVNLALPRPGEQQRAAIDVLSCTTTMEVGIDIGSLSGVALRNMPPSRANYQQRAGRAGRRGNAVATVLAFGSADTHDDHYFRQPELMIRGKVDDPILTMDNDEIARRHVTAYLLQRYHQDRLPKIEPDMQPQLFEVLGTVGGFVGTTSPLNRTDLADWLKVNESVLRGEIASWLPTELSASDRGTLLDGIVTRTLGDIDRALDLDLDGSLPEPSEGDSEPEADEVEAEGPAEDGAEAPSARRSQTNLLDRLLYKGVLPRYAFPTDVVGFHVFDIDRSTPYRAKFLYEPSQGLPVALSQYAPGKVVWIDNKEWTSGALYAPVRKELSKAWEDKLLYFECEVCHYAKHFSPKEAERGEKRDCPACGAADKFGAAKNWIRPPGFAHRAKEAPGTSPDDAPARSYATRAKLVAPGPTEESAWQHVTDRLEQTYRRETLLVTNTGPRTEGYTYCTLCGLIEPTATPSTVVVGPHPKPYPDEKEPSCPGSRSTRGLVLGTDFISDVLLVRLKVAAPITLRPAFLSTHVALRTIAEGLTIAATRKLDIEANELQAEYRPALTPLGGEGLESEIYLYDTLAGGAGFTRRVNDYGMEIFEQTLKLLEECPAGCDESCYRCLRSFRNRFEHGLLDRHVGASLLRYLINGTPPQLDPARLNQSADKLFEDLTSHGINGVTFERKAEVEIEGIGPVTAPILATKGEQQWIFGVHGPLTPDVAPTDDLRDAKEFGAVPVRLVDDIVIARNLPFASHSVRDSLT